MLNESGTCGHGFDRGVFAFTPGSVAMQSWSHARGGLTRSLSHRSGNPPRQAGKLKSFAVGSSCNDGSKPHICQTSLPRRVFRHRHPPPLLDAACCPASSLKFSVAATNDC
jgi:hypothetical protein